MAKNALGKGLGALIKQVETVNAEQPSGTSDRIAIDSIEINPYQPRTHFDHESINELASSIKQLGIIQPITVRETGKGKYQIISGERRYRAAIIAGLTEIPAYIRYAEDNNMLELALVENIQREDLDSIEIAISYQRLIDECQLTQENVSARVGKKRSTITNYLRLLKLPAEIQSAIRQKQISMGHAKALVNVEQTERQTEILYDIIENGLSVRHVEAIVHRINHPEEETETAEAAVAVNNGQPDNTANAHEVAPTVDAEPEQNSVVPDEPEKITHATEERISEKTEPTPASNGNNKHADEPDLNIEDEHLKEQLSRRFGATVNIKRFTSGAGQIVIPFRTDDELQYIVQMSEKI